jgi:regulator of protease activity HflC (stomatin/prohibitin superfamily)
MSVVMAILLTIIVILCSTLAIAIVVAYLTHFLWLPVLLSKMAKRNWPITIVEEGTAKVITNSGKAWRCITASADTDPDLDPDPTKGWEVTKKKTKEGIWNVNGREPWWVEWIDSHLPGGMRWVGLWPSIYKIHKYNFRWSVLRESEPLASEDSLVGKRQLTNGKWVASFSKRIDYIYLRDSVYYFELSETETRGSSEKGSQDKSVGITVAIYMVATVRVVNPYLALFQVHDWLSSIFDLIRPSIRSWVSSIPAQEVVGKYEAAQREHDIFLRMTGVPDETATAAEEKPKPIVDYVEHAYGIRVKRIAFDDVVLPEKYTESVILRAEAEQNKIRIHTEAEAEADRLETVAKGEAARVKLLTVAIAKGGDAARLVRTLEAYEAMGAASNTIVVGGQNPVQMLIETSKKGKKGNGEK